MPIPELITFFRPFAEDAERLIAEADSLEDKTALRMLYDIFRFPQYADKIQEVPRSTEQIQMFFLVTLCEALYNLYEPENTLGSKKRVNAFFEAFVGDDADFFKYKFQRSIMDDECLGDKGCHLTPDELVTVLYDLRCSFTHEGVNTEMQFSDGEYDTMCTITHQDGKETTYELKATYEDFRSAFIRMGLRCVRAQLATQGANL